MSKVNNIKETVKVITITKQLQKINFQIRHPENVFAIIGIAVTCDKIGEFTGDILPPKGNTAGNISLSIAQKGDVVFSDDVKIDSNDYADIPEKRVYGLQFDIASAKKRQLYFKTFYRIDKALLEGFYEDTYSPSMASDGVELPLYKIRIYIRYQVSDTNYLNAKP
ncbi:MAG: hypothetical protein Q8L81_05715 [Bacteroidota bacterium]|nr:hypothetical protein [Bacteroidota bacterium]